MIRSLPLALLTYRLAATLAGPAAPALLRWRAGRGKEDEARLAERTGLAGLPRPDGELVWAHGASIGEALSLLPVVNALCERGLAVLVTSGTRSAAAVLTPRLPAGALHQFLPLDAPRFVARFLDHWRPRLALFAESEVWPNIVLELDRRSVPLVLVNGRLSARSARGWGRAPATARALFGRFALCIPQGAADGERLGRLGAAVAPVAGNLKFDIPPPPADPAAVERLAGLAAGRPIWMAASTHPGEDEHVLEAHRALARDAPGLLTILAPRHPGRAAEVAQLATGAGLLVGRRSAGGGFAGTDVHLVDTVGELGLFYRLSPIVFMGGSIVPHGGQNPIEPVRLGAAILHGPHTHNFTDVYDTLDAAGGALSLGDGGALAGVLRDLLADPGLVREMARAASGAIAGFGGALARTMSAIEPFLPARPSP